MFNWVKNADGSIAPGRLIFLAAVVSTVCTVGGMVIGNFLERK